MDSTSNFVSASQASRLTDTPAGKFFALIHSGLISVDGKLADGTLIFRRERLPEIRQRIETARHAPTELAPA